MSYALALWLAWLVAPLGRHECFWIVVVATAMTFGNFLNGPPVVIGPRVYVPSSSSNRVGCWDYSTSAT